MVAYAGHYYFVAVWCVGSFKQRQRHCTFYLHAVLMRIGESKISETHLVLCTGFLIIYLVASNILFLYIALAFGIIGIFIPPLAKLITIGWFKLADILQYMMSKVILGTLFFIVLFPVSLLYRIFAKERPKKANHDISGWKDRNVTYSPSDLENIW